MRILRHEALPLEVAERFAALSTTWKAQQPFRLEGYDSMHAAMQGYAAFHAALSQREDAPILTFVPNQYGLGNRLRALKSSLLLAMLMGRVFRVRWVSPYPLETLARPEAFDWREPLVGARHSGGKRSAPTVLCLPFGASNSRSGCSKHLDHLSKDDVREVYLDPELEIESFTDIFIYLSKNRHYKALLERLGRDCPNRMGCLLPYVLGPQRVVAERLAALFPGEMAATKHVGVQVRNRLWRIEAQQLKGLKTSDAAGILACMAKWVPPEEYVPVFFTSDDDDFYPAARKLWGSRLREQSGEVYGPWSRGGAQSAEKLDEDDENAVIKAFVDWFALQQSSVIIYTYGSSFAKTAAEGSEAPNIDVNHTRCRAEDAGVMAHAVPMNRVTYDTSKVPGTMDYVRPSDVTRLTS